MPEILEFKIGKQKLAFDVDSVEMVIEYPKVTPVPGAPNFVKGVINLRGRIVTLVKLDEMLDLDKGEEEFGQVLVLNIGGEEVGIPVHSVDEVLMVDENEIETPVSQHEKYANKVKGIVKKEDRLIMYLDVRKILNLENKEQEG
ncbi:MAG: chemotaxis protein CheW [Thermotogae bacterium]|nr:chemotaxis protein CheW [Thermotogota bacterium]